MTSTDGKQSAGTFALTALRISKPSMPGMCRSIIRRSGASERIRSTAFIGSLSDEMDPSPARERMRLRSTMFDGSSSMMRTRDFLLLRIEII